MVMNYCTAPEFVKNTYPTTFPYRKKIAEGTGIKLSLSSEILFSNLLRRYAYFVRLVFFSKSL